MAMTGSWEHAENTVCSQFPVIAMQPNHQAKPHEDCKAIKQDLLNSIVLFILEEESSKTNKTMELSKSCLIALQS